MTNLQNQIPEEDEDVRVKMLNTFLTCPHRNTGEIDKVHAELQEADPLFYVHLAAWYQRHGDIRDHKEVFAARLIVDDYHPNRNTGIALWQKQPFWMKNRIIGFVTGKDVKVRDKTSEKGTRMSRGKRVTYTKSASREVHVGLDKNIPRSFKRELKNYLKYLENNVEKFDATVARNADDVKQLYFTSKTRPFTDRAHDVLFKRKYPEDSKLKKLQEVAKEADPVEQAKAIVREKIPFTTAIGMIEDPTPAAWVALLEVMSPQEAINHAATLEEHGLMDNPATKEIILAKLKRAEKSKKVTALKGKEAKKTGRIQNEEMSKQLDKIADEQVKKIQIKAKTCIAVDKSGSMTVAIEAGKHVAALVSGASAQKPVVVAFDNAAFPVTSRGDALSDWEQAFLPVRAHGRTRHGAVLTYLDKMNDTSIEQFVFITDERETETPTFASMYEAYAAKTGTRPFVAVVHVDLEDYEQRYGRSTVFSNSLKAAGIEYDVYDIKGTDYYALPELLNMLARKSKLDMVYEVMATPLPARSTY